MKVAISSVGTGRRFIRPELVMKLKESGCTVYRIGQKSSDEISPDYDRYGVKYIPISLERSNTNPWKELKVLLEVRKNVRAIGLDSIIIYGIKTFPAVVIGARLAGVKRIVCIVNGSGRLFRLQGPRGFIIKLLSYPALILAFLLADQVFIQNNDDLQMMKRKWLLWRKNYANINGSGVNLQRFSYTKLPKDMIFTMISRLTGLKGVNEFVRAANIVKERYPETQFQLIGPIDSEQGDVKIDVDLLNAAIESKTVNYVGRVENVKPYLDSCRVFVLPSYYPEGIPRSILEAMSTGRPIITTDSPGCRETVEDGRNGFLVPPRDHEKLAEKMIWMIENDLEVEKMAIYSRQLCEEKFDINSINDKIVQSVIR
ncbi:MAG: glycosyltransferase family 4 protein [Clostridiales bacterium]|nr:glycosyltransferase family 4 protein [Clostridiales bacterium]